MTELPTHYTERLCLRPLVTADLDGLFRLIYADPQVSLHFCGSLTREEATHIHAHKVIHNQSPNHRGYGYWAVVRQRGQVLIGQILMGPPESAPWIALPRGVARPPLGREVELGYALGRAYWGHGYATEACHAVINYAFQELGLPRFVSSCRRANTRSIRLMERLGFQIHDNLEDPDTVVGILEPRSTSARRS